MPSREVCIPFRGLTFCFVVAIAGCGTTATISRGSGAPVDGKIVGADSQHVYIENAAGTKYPIAKSEITDIDHPGDGAIVTGAAIGGYGLINIAVGLPHCGENGGAYCVGVFTPAAVGLPLMIWGFVTHAESTGALHAGPPRGTALLRPVVTPLAPIGSAGPTGASLGWRF